MKRPSATKNRAEKGHEQADLSELDNECLIRKLSVRTVSRGASTTQKPGLVIVPGFLDEDFREALLQEINFYAHLFKPAPRKHLNAHQEFSYSYIGEADEEPVPVQSNFKAVLALRDRYSDLNGAMWSVANFSTAGRLNSVAVQDPAYI